MSQQSSGGCQDTVILVLIDQPTLPTLPTEGNVDNREKNLTQMTTFLLIQQTISYLMQFNLHVLNA